MLRIACGTVVGVAAWIWLDRLVIGVVLTKTISLAMVTTCFLGVRIPVFLRKTMKNHRVAAGPIVLAQIDVLTLLIYFIGANFFP